MINYPVDVYNVFYKKLFRRRYNGRGVNYSKKSVRDFFDFLLIFYWFSTDFLLFCRFFVDFFDFSKKVYVIFSSDLPLDNGWVNILYNLLPTA